MREREKRKLESIERVTATQLSLLTLTIFTKNLLQPQQIEVELSSSQGGSIDHEVELIVPLTSLGDPALGAAEDIHQCLPLFFFGIRLLGHTAPAAAFGTEAHVP